MKKIFVITVLVVASVAIATAQQRQMPSVEERAKTQTEFMEKQVGLKDDQKAKIKAIDLEFAKQMDEQIQKNRGDRDAMRTKMREIDTARDAKYKEILTDEQFKKYLEEKAKREKELQERRAQRSR